MSQTDNLYHLKIYLTVRLILCNKLILYFSLTNKYQILLTKSYFI